MTILRSPHDKQNPYVMLNKSALHDPDLSWGAKGLWAYLISLPDDWKIQVTHLSTIFKGKGGGEKAIYSFLNELIEAGYCYRSQNQNDKGQFGEIDYLITEFKKSLPHSPQRDAVERDAFQSPITNKQDVLKNKTTTNKKAVVVFSCLKDRNDLTLEEKQSLMRYPEERVLKALEFAKTNPPLKGLIQELIWHCKQKEPPKSAIQGNPEENKRLAWNYERCDSRIVVLNRHVEFVINGPYQPICIEYDDKKFKEKFDEALTKFGIKIS